MGSEIEIPETPNWLKELEAKREKRLKTKLGHELGAGAPCLTCEEKCPGLDLHFWRKICKNCKCSKESHEVQDDDIYGWAQDELLGTKVNRLKRKIVLPGRKEEVELEWTPNGHKETIDKYLKTIPPELLPIKGSQAAQDRKQLLKKQIPIHDIDPTLCHELTNEELEKMQEYISHVKQCSVGVGQLIQINVNKGTTHVFDKNNAMFLINNVPKNVADSHNVLLEAEQNSVPLKNLTNALSSLELKSTNTYVNKSTAIGNNPLYSKLLSGNQQKEYEPMNGLSYNQNIEKIPSDVANSTNVSAFTHSKAPSGMNLLNYNAKTNNNFEQYQSPTFRPIKDLHYTMNKSQEIPEISKFNDNEINENTGQSMYKEPFTSHLLKESANSMLSKSGDSHKPPQSSSPLNKYLNKTQGITKGFKVNNLPNSNIKVGEDRQVPTYFRNIKDLAFSTYEKPLEGMENSGTETNSVTNSEYMQPLVHNSENENQTIYPPQFGGVLSPIPTKMDDTKSENYAQNKTAMRNVAKSDIQEYMPQKSNVYEEELEPSFVPIDGIRDILYEESPEIRAALSKDNAFFEQLAPNKFIPNLTTALPTCHYCHETFKLNELAVSIPERSDAVFHTDCFKCHGCNQILADMFYFYDKATENVYCGRDYAKIRGIPRCRACDELIFVKEYCLAEYATFHVKHFCCFECDKPLAGQNYVMENNQPMCVPCFELIKANKCYACNDVIHPDQQGLQLKDGVHFHATDDCFACKVCKKSLFSAKLLFRSDRLYCSHDCYSSDV